MINKPETMGVLPWTMGSLVNCPMNQSHIWWNIGGLKMLRYEDSYRCICRPGCLSLHPYICVIIDISICPSII